MTLQNKILPVALVAALLGGGVGAFVTRSTSSTQPATTASTTATQPAATATTATEATADQGKINATTDDQTAFRDGFAEGYRAASGVSDSAVAPTARRSAL